MDADKAEAAEAALEQGRAVSAYEVTKALVHNGRRLNCLLQMLRT
jgi:hypothetical protein